jgi:hypothetical protein
MKIKNCICILLILLNFINSYSQEQPIKYVDEKYAEISFKEYSKRLKSNLFETTLVYKDEIIYKKLRYKEYFGEIPKTKKDQIAKLFLTRYNIDTTKVWFIHYLDTIPNAEKMPKVSGIELLDDFGKPIGKFVTNNEYRNNFRKYIQYKHKHVTSKQDYIESIKRERGKVDEDEIELIHFYNVNKGFSEKVLTSNGYFNDQYAVVRKLFNDGMMAYKTIIIFPDGKFYASRFGLFQEEKKLTKIKNYQKHRKKWFKKLGKSLSQK